MVNIERKKASLNNRLAAACLDIFILMMGFILLNNFFVTPIFNLASDYNQVYDTYVQELVDSRMYKEDENNNVIFVLDNFTLDELTTYDEIITYNYNLEDGVIYE